MRPGRLLGIAAALCLAGCGSSSNGGDATTKDTEVKSATIATIRLTSTAFQDGRPIPAQYSCDGANQTPSLSWGEPPAGTKSFALVIDDPDAPGGTFRHWGVFDIPASARSIGGSQRVGTEVKNDKGTLGYAGPCPPKGNGIHHYHFKLFALDTAHLDLRANAKVVDVENEASKHALAQGELIGTFERK
jgi:Raf kinase inhibitor-like YbhB/YbcL family protein